MLPKLLTRRPRNGKARQSSDESTTRFPGPGPLATHVFSGVLAGTRRVPACEMDHASKTRSRCSRSAVAGDSDLAYHCWLKDSTLRKLG
jgi:hypothetical protein